MPYKNTWSQELEILMAKNKMRWDLHQLNIKEDDIATDKVKKIHNLVKKATRAWVRKNKLSRKESETAMKGYTYNYHMKKYLESTQTYAARLFEHWISKMQTRPDKDDRMDKEEWAKLSPAQKKQRIMFGSNGNISNPYALNSSN